MFKNLKIRNKILLSILSINMIILIGIFVIYISFTQDIVVKETQEKAMVTVQEINKSLSGFLEEKAKIGWSFCNSPWVKEWLEYNEKRFIKPGEDPKYDAIKQYMVSLKENDGEVQSVFISSEKSDMYYDNIGYRVDDTYKVTTRGWYKTAATYGRPSFDFDADFTSGKIFVNYRNPVFSASGKLLGIGGIDISLKFLDTFLKKASAFETSEVSLISKDGSILFHPDSNLILKKKLSDFVDDDENYNNIGIVAGKIKNGESGFEEVIYNGKEKYFIFAKMENLDWTILLSVDKEEINAPVDSLMGTSTVIFLLSILVLSVAIVLVANNISKPIINLSNNVAELTRRGSSDINMNIDSTDEVGELAASFKEMMMKIKNKIIAAEQISQGNINVDIDIISNEDTLGIAMKRMKESISSLIHEIEKLSLASSEGNLSVRTETNKYQGEFRSILEGINNTVDTLLQPTNEAIQTLEKVANRNLTVRMTGNYKGDNAKLQKFMNSAIENLDTALQQVSNTLDSHTEAAYQISQLTEEIAVGIEKQTFQTTEVSTSIEEMTSTILETSKNASIMAETADNAKKSAIVGGGVVEKTISGMKNISFKVNRSAEVVHNLGKSSEEIGEIISVINDIADQTNLLALNAAIEAARAGEQGRGFAVVADEVRKLAERTTKATKEIENMINKIQKDTTEAVSAMQEGKEEVNLGIQLADEAGIALKEIVEISGEVTERVVQIASANEQQSSVSEQISHNIENINSLSQQTASGMQLISQHVEDFKDLTEHLKKLNQNFITSRKYN